MCHLGNKHSELVLFVKSVTTTSSISAFLSRFARKPEHSFSNVGMAEQSASNSGYGAVNVFTENYRTV